MVHKNTIYRSALIFVIALAFFVSWECTSQAPQQQIETRIGEMASSIYDEIVEIRRDLHKHPELSERETRTSGVIAQQLKSMGLEVIPNVGGYGVVGILRGKSDRPVVAYRADMDALPQDIQEQVPFKSVIPGVSHACGHDVHVAVGLGVAKVLSFLKKELSGSVKFIFQPAEETGQGAKHMIADGVLDNPTPDAIFATHVAPVETGKIITSPGVGLPGAELFVIKLSGGKNLEEATQASLNSIHGIGTVTFPRSMEEYEKIGNAMLEENSFLSDFIFSMANIDNKQSSAEKKIINGLFKAANSDGYKRAREQLHKALSDLDRYNITHEVIFTDRFPDMICDKDIAMQAITPIKAVLGEDSVLIAYSSNPFHGEDFAFFLQRIPGAMFFLGASNSSKGIHAVPHSPVFSVDEKAILIGVKGMASIIAHYLLAYRISTE